MKSLLIAAFLTFSVPVGAEEWSRLAGPLSGVRETRAVVVTDPAAWQRLWKEHAKPFGDSQPVPEVDFKKEMVVAVFLGERPTGGYSVAVEFLPSPAARGELLVRYKENKPSGGAELPSVMTQPFEFRKVPRSYVRVRVVSPEGRETPLSVPRFEEAPQNSDPQAKLMQSRRAQARVAGLSSKLQNPLLASAAFDGNGKKGAGAVYAMRDALAALPPPPGKQEGGRLQPPPAGKQETGKPLPPPPGKKPEEGKPLPPPPGQGGNQGGKPLPPPPGQRPLPQPMYPGGPLPRDNARLQDAERTWSTYGMRYVGYWLGNTDYKTGEGRVVTTPEDRGNVYILKLDSGKYRRVMEFYHEPKEDRMFYAVSETRVGGESRRLVVEFLDRDTNPLMPWEKESFTFSLTGSKLALESSDGAYRYQVSYSYEDRDQDTVQVAMKPLQKRLTQPDPAAVDARLVSTGAGLRLEVSDKWAEQYKDEDIEITAVIRKDDGSWWRRDPKVFESTEASPIRVTVGAGMGVDIPASGSGTFYLESWSFRRAGSRFTLPSWVYKGKGNTIQR
ncbi:MAG: protease complex subunit PrcB family protein [Elusimicrobiota bacterium]